MEYTDMERRILDMWPKYEDGAYVWIGDDVSGMDVRSFVFTESGVMVTNLTSVPAYGECRKYGEPLKRPAPKVLDADGVEIKVGDTVWHEDGTMLRVDGFGGIEDGETIVNVHIIRGATQWSAVRSLSLTHTRPDSWERLERDAEKSICDYFGSSSSPDSLCEDGCPGLNSPVNCGVLMKLDLIRRAKALAEKEAAR